MTIMDVVEARIWREAETQARDDARRFETDLLRLIDQHGLDDFSRSVSGPAVAAYTKSRANLLASRYRDAIMRRLFAGVENLQELAQSGQRDSLGTGDRGPTIPQPRPVR